MKYKALLAGLILLVLTGSALAEKQRLGIDFTTIWYSKFIWYGRDYFNNHAGTFTDVDLDLYQTDFHAGFINASSGGGKSVNLQGHAYYMKYVSSIFEDSPLETDYQLRWQYYDFFDNPKLISSDILETLIIYITIVT